MDCRDFETRLEALLDGALDEAERGRCERHLVACPGCRELVAPFAAAVAAPEGLVGAVLERTSGPTCGGAGMLLAARVDEELPPAERELLAAHLERCAGCRALAAVIPRLAQELPRLAEVEPDPRFVADVLAATLPPPVRLRRFWQREWPRWVRRPRFASEAAFVATLVLALVFASPGSPFAAVPAKALELTRSDPAARLEAPVAELEARFSARLEEPLRERWRSGRAAVTSWAGALGDEGRGLAGELRARLGTTWERAASLFTSTEQEPSSAEEPPSDR